MRNLFIIVGVLAIVFWGCECPPPPVKATLTIEEFINYSIMDSNKIENFVNVKKGSDDYKFIEIILKYNNDNDEKYLSDSIDSINTNEQMKKRLLLLSVNL